MSQGLNVLQNSGDPDAPDSGYRSLYPKSDGWYEIDSAGSVFKLTNAVTGSGVVATNGYTLTLPASGTAALLGIANVFTQTQTINPGVSSDNGLDILNTATGYALKIRQTTGITQSWTVGVLPTSGYLATVDVTTGSWTDQAGGTNIESLIITTGAGNVYVKGALYCGWKATAGTSGTPVETDLLVSLVDPTTAYHPAIVSLNILGSLNEEYLRFYTRLNSQRVLQMTMYAAAGTEVHRNLNVAGSLNVGIALASLGSAPPTGAISISRSISTPAGNTNTVTLWADAGVLKYRDQTGTVRTISYT